MTDKGLNLSDDCAAQCLYILALPSYWGYSKIYTPDTIANWQKNRALAKINKTGAVVRLRILVELWILQHIYRHLFRVISNEMSVLHFNACVDAILVFWRCIQRNF